jgi:peptidoglycan/xylan/chitin deacetylase (PgdA/CDA1 family)
MVYIFICVDFDRDYGVAVRNVKHSVSKPIFLDKPSQIKKPETSTSIQGTSKSFDPFMEFLISKELPVCFYFEARSLEMFYNEQPTNAKLFNQPFFEIGIHGFNHEDLSGEETGLIIENEEEKEIIRKAKEKVKALLKNEISGFRAPYMRLSNHTLDILQELGFVYDSSLYRESIQGLLPYFIKNELVEFPVIKTPKMSPMKGMYTYLWPLFEGKRSIRETVENYLQIARNSKDVHSYISINLHSWHFAYNIEHHQYLPEDEIIKNLRMFEEIIIELRKLDNVVFSTPKNWLEEHKELLTKL